MVGAAAISACLYTHALAPMVRRKEPVDVLDVSGVGKEWDQTDDIRDRLRKGASIIHEEAKQDDVSGCCYCSTLLVPILTRMSLKESKPLPPVDDLRAEIEQIYSRNKRGTTPEDQEQVVKASWKIKKLCGFVKMKCRREEVSTAT